MGWNIEMGELTRIWKVRTPPLTSSASMSWALFWCQLSCLLGLPFVTLSLRVGTVSAL